MDFSNKFGLKKSIKSQFEYDLDQILAGGRSNSINLTVTNELFENGCKITFSLLAEKTLCNFILGKKNFLFFKTIFPPKGIFLK